MYRVLASTLLALVPSIAFANCPTSLDPTSRLNCFNRAINAAATTMASLQAENTALETANADLATRLDAAEAANAALEARVSDTEARADLQDGDIADLFTASSSTDATVAGIQSDVDDLTTTLDTLGVIDVGDLFTYLTVDTATNSVIFSGANVYVQSGSGATDGPVNGLGNLIVGYDEDATLLGASAASDRTGSNNLVVGSGNAYSSYGGLVAGTLNTVSGVGASALGGILNVASGGRSVVVGGATNLASGSYTTILGGWINTASGSYSSVSGGEGNTAGGAKSSVLGGASNQTTGSHASISGGGNNVAGGSASSILGGNAQTTSTSYETVP